MCFSGAFRIRGKPVKQVAIQAFAFCAGLLALLAAWRFYPSRLIPPKISCFTAEDCVRLGYRLLYEANFSSAYSAFQEAININPGGEEGFVGMGRLFENQPNRGQAMRVLAGWIRVHPDAFGARAALGYLEDIEGNGDEAILQYTRALNGNTETRLFSRQHRGILFSRMGESRRAMRDFIWCERKDPADDLYPFLTGSLFERSGNFSAAYRCYQKAATLLSKKKYYPWSLWNEEVLRHRAAELKERTGLSLEGAISRAADCGELAKQ